MPKLESRPGLVGRLRVGLVWLRFFYLVLLPLAGCAAIKAAGYSIGHGWGLGIAIGLFLYHYLLWALHETERLRMEFGIVGVGSGLWIATLSPILVLVAVRGSVSDWLVEQTLLEAGAFVAAVGVLAVRKAGREGKEAPWFLVILVFVLPPGAILWGLGGFWLFRHGGDVLGSGTVLLGVAALLSLRDRCSRIGPYVTGVHVLAEPLSSSARTVLAVVWFIGLLAGGIWLGG